MIELKNTLSYQVHFTSNPTTVEKNLFLTFFFKGKPIPVQDERNLLPLLNKAVDTDRTSFKIPNIVEVSPNADIDLQKIYSSLFCVMFTEKKGRRKETKKKGLLMGKSIYAGYFIFGIWPYPFYLESEPEIEKISNYIEELTTNSKSFSEILLLTEK
ncbi:MAG: hypothetical protein EU530_06565 [Promethearchaeota archaeon]|nr:MAG: hypothetical protein EU530_06565 [Candidatus Lokiarchaeota archaeon]